MSDVVTSPTTTKQVVLATAKKMLTDGLVEGTSGNISGRLDNGLVVFDTGRHPEHTRQIIDFASAKKKPVVAIVNSHWHLDHVGGNVLLRENYPDVRVYASGAIEDAMHGFLANYHAQLEDVIKKAGDDTSKQAPWRAGTSPPPKRCETRHGQLGGSPSSTGAFSTLASSLPRASQTPSSRMPASFVWRTCRCPPLYSTT